MASGRGLEGRPAVAGSEKMSDGMTHANREGFYGNPRKVSIDELVEAMARAAAKDEGIDPDSLFVPFDGGKTVVSWRRHKRAMRAALNAIKAYFVAKGCKVMMP